ncbi:MFS transporter [Saccharobesus litoralis]|uniref:MFS transporter n=1 Tax=Saccharobesus litoralis TaxID=2172099 RepID=A0A2S0VQV7_9ALTE|nr:MFS transporter [Saccharobesus litoralis]AWB66601.1 MFS transporter [Saccharobesus litoralis]
MTKGTFSLFSQRRFLPYFCTQALGAFNDNVYKNSFLLLVAFMSAANLPIGSDLIINLAAGLFILPFFIFSAHAGLLADKLEKSAYIRRVKLFEVFIMAIAAVALLTQQVILLLLLLFLMGCQSAYFGPVKYALLPQHLAKDELVAGNALVELGTFLAILLGTLLAGVIMAQSSGATVAAVLVVVFALLGYLAARKIPYAAPIAPELEVTFSPFKQGWQVVKQCRQQKSIFIAILAISWFWFYGATFLTQFPNLAKQYLQSSPQVVSVLLAIFSVGIGLGSILCSRLSQGKVKLNLVPIGALGLTLFAIHIYWAIPDYGFLAGQVQNASQFLSFGRNYYIMLDLLLIGVFGGLYIVPLYAYIQREAKPEQRAQMIAANNIINALFMVVSAVFAIVLLSVAQLTIPALLAITGAISAVVSGLIFFAQPEYLKRN